ncbi:hypothetical protein JCM6882_005556 [Rhodosporidiobolus microsporus]
MASPAPVLALVGATGLVGSALLESFTSTLQTSRLSTLRILTSRPSAPALAAVQNVPGVEIKEVHYGVGGASLDAALEGADVLVSAMGASETGEGKYEENKKKLVEAAVRAGVKVYVPSEWGTDHNGRNGDVVSSPMFKDKQKHHAWAQEQGLRVLAVYCGLILEISFSDWLGIPISSPSPTWTIPTPPTRVAFTSLTSLGPFTLSAILQTLSSSFFSPSNLSSPIPTRLRIYSDCLSIDEAADLWEKAAGGKVERVYRTEEELRERWETVKPTLKEGMLGPAIPLMMSMGGFDHTKDSANELLNVGDFAFKPKTVADFLQEKARELKKEDA